MLPLEPVPRAQLRGRQPGDARDLRRARRRDLLPRALPAAGRRLRRARGRAGDRCRSRSSMFLLSRRFGALADRFGPRWLHGRRAAGRRGRARAAAAHRRPTSTTSTDLLPALLVFALGLSVTVAPLTATVLADADEHNAGIASGVNNAIARVAGLLAIAALGAVVAGQFASTIDERLAGHRLSPAGAANRRRGQAAARSRAPTPTACPAAEARVVTQAAEDAAVTAFHRGAGDRGRARGARRRARPRRHPQPAPRGAVRGLPGRPAHRGSARGSAPAGGTGSGLTRVEQKAYATQIRLWPGPQAPRAPCVRAGARPPTSP